MPMEVAYTVQGSWPFPLDMLRYDDARPATEDDRVAIEHLSGDCAPDRLAIRVPTRIDLIAPRRPATARWESFGWSLPGDIEYAAVKRSQSESLRRRELIDSAREKLTAEEWAALKWMGLKA